jgi:predicted amino acid racemase/arginase family enzyme
MAYPCLDIDLGKIEANCRIITDLCRARGIAVAGVTKVVCGLPKVARAMLRGGVSQLADSRLENLARLRADGIRAEFILLRIPMMSQAAQVVELADVSLNSELPVIRALSEAAAAAGRRHRIILMIDIGDLREGVLPTDALAVAEQVLALPGVELHGVGTNLACLSGIQPSRRNMDILVYIAGEIRRRLGVPLPVVSGGNTFNLPLVESGEMPAGVNHLRLGAGLLMAVPPISEALRARLHGDAFSLHAEILELKDKPSAPYGQSGEDAFGKKPVFEDRGTIRRAILGIGREDVMPEWLHPREAGAAILGASSDHLILDVTAVARELAVGGELAFGLDYGAVLAAMTSQYVHKNVIGAQAAAVAARRVRVIGVPLAAADGAAGGSAAPRLVREAGLAATLAAMGLAVADDGDIGFAPGAADAAVAEAVERALAAGELPVVLGGTHSILHGELAGLGRFTDEFGLICFDAHGDLITTIAAGAGQTPLALPLENFALIGVRALTDEERRLLEASPITVFTMEDVDRLGMVKVVERSLALAESATAGLHVSMDLDFLDSREVPGVAFGEPGGISFREAHLAMEMIAESRRLSSADLAEIDAGKEGAAATAKVAVGLLASLLGRKLLAKRPE